MVSCSGGWVPSLFPGSSSCWSFLLLLLHVCGLVGSLQVCGCLGCGRWSTGAEAELHVKKKTLVVLHGGEDGAVPGGSPLTGWQSRVELGVLMLFRGATGRISLKREWPCLSEPVKNGLLDPFHSSECMCGLSERVMFDTWLLRSVLMIDWEVVWFFPGLECRAEYCCGWAE
ncbi:hypothetical protein RJT34_20561 [Clitoria ternatea]|uniref:Uncharacterized protein n=1 Tax=Clitoria ternatea TaxID=43366 RepID=A0AAN9IT15_CLITE